MASPKVTPTKTAVRGGMLKTRGSPLTGTSRGRGVVMTTRGRGNPTMSARGGRIMTASRGMASARGVSARGALMARGRGQTPGLGVRGGGITKPGQGRGQPMMRGQKSMVVGQRTGQPPPLRASPQVSMRGQQRPQQSMTMMRPQMNQVQQDPYYMAAYGGQNQYQQPNYYGQQQQNTVQRPAQVSPGKEELLSKDNIVLIPPPS